MIVRIKKIVQVGVFHNFITGGPIDFSSTGNITVVFGRNRRGKTTLACIFQSLANNDPSLIVGRVSIPADSSLSKLIEITFKDGSTEENISFKADTWDSDKLKGRVLVFDQDFMHKNLMLGTEVTRENKVNFTDFVLGEDGVEKTEKIKERNKKLRDDSRDLPNHRPDFVRQATPQEALAFVRLSVDATTKPSLEKEKGDLEKTLSTLEKAEDFRALDKVEKLEEDDIEKKLSGLTEELDAIMGLTYSDVRADSKQKLQEHISTHTDGQGAEEWLRKGYTLAKNGICPFCSQSTTGVQELIDAYGEIFTKEFEAYTQNLKSRIKTFYEDLESEISDSYITLRSRQLVVIQSYMKFIPEIDEESTGRISEKIAQVGLARDQYKTSLEDWKAAVRRDFHTKIANQGQAFEVTANSEAVRKAANLLANKIKLLDSEIGTHIEAINKVRDKIEKLRPEEISSQIAKLRLRIGLNEKSIARIEQDAQCKIYNSKIVAIEAETKAISKAVSTLEGEQSEYLEEYFDRLNYWFNYFGSDGFKINKTTNNQGDKKVYSLEVAYNGQKISPSDLHTIFSESDRRNLALSVFMAKIEKISDKANKIIVFDDPVVSFDDNRIQNTCIKLKTIAGEYKQLIILTHYSSVIKELFRSNTKASYLVVERDGIGSILNTLDVEKFTSSSHERDYNRLAAFIDGEKDEGILHRMRPFLEQSLKLRFQKQLTEGGLHNAKLGEIITFLQDYNFVEDQTSIELTNLKDSLNPDHHSTVDDENIEEVRGIAKTLISLVYDVL